MLTRRKTLQLAASAVAMPFVSHMASAQAYPNRPVRLLVGFTAGGGTDVAARVMAEWLSQQFRQQFIVENRLGQAGNIANAAAAQAAADGYTLLFTGPNSTISASLYKKLPYDLLRDFVPVGGMMRFPNVMIVPATLPVKSVREFIDYAKANPGQLSMASSGVGSSVHLSGELFKFMTKIDMVHVPYRGGAAAYPDLISGKVHVMFDNLSGPVLELVNSGQLRALGITTKTRWAATPEVPAVAETVPGYEAIIWYGICAPKNTPTQIISVLNRQINAALKDQKVVARIAEGGGVPMPTSPSEFGEFIKADVQKWRTVIEFAGISAD